MPNDKLTFTSESGKFQIISELGDTLIVSYVGFKSKQLVVKNFDFHLIPLKKDFIEFDEVRVTNFPEDMNQFKRKIIDQEMVEIDSLIAFGVTPGKPKGKVPKLYHRETDVVFGTDDQFNSSDTIPISYFTKKNTVKNIKL